jgi:hypothetical protein
MDPMIGLVAREDKVSEVERAEAEGVVSPSGEVVVSSDAVRRLALAPGQRVHVTVTAPVRRRNLYGALAGRLPDIDPAEIEAARRDVWGDLAAGQ